jgi:hypothetical protein
MDVFEAGCQGLGLALAAGALAGAPGRPQRLAVVLAIAAAIAGAVLFGVSFDEEEVSDPEVHWGLWVGFFGGALAALLSWWVASDVVAGARSRAQTGSGVGLFVALYALALAGLSLLVSPVALVALAGTAWLAIGRRRREARKYEGLRSLR